jgi:hypothetical protein
VALAWRVFPQENSLQVSLLSRNKFQRAIAARSWRPSSIVGLIDSSKKSTGKPVAPSAEPTPRLNKLFVLQNIAGLAVEGFADRFER